MPPNKPYDHIADKALTDGLLGGATFNESWVGALIGKNDIAEDRSVEVKYVTYGVTAKEKVKARYVKVHMENVGIGPSWHYGVGYPVWMFTDEIWVY